MEKSENLKEDDESSLFLMAVEFLFCPLINANMWLCFLLTFYKSF